MQRGEVVVGIERTDHLRLGDWMVAPVRHVLLARPDQLHRCAGYLLCDRDCLMHEVVGGAPAEAAAERYLVDVAFGNRQAGSLGQRGQCRLGDLRGHPRFTAIRRIKHGGVHRLHGGVVLVRIGVDRLDLLRRAGNGLFHVAVLVADEGLIGVEPSLEELRDAGARNLGVLALVPGRWQRVERGFRLPPALGNDRDSAVANLHHMLDAGHALHLGGVKARELAAEDRAVLDRGAQHAGQLQIQTVNLRSGELGRGVETLERFAGDLPVLRILERHILGLLDLCSGFGDLAEGRGSPRRVVFNHAV